jgi:hypothetical protein
LSVNNDLSQKLETSISSRDVGLAKNISRIDEYIQELHKDHIKDIQDLQKDQQAVIDSKKLLNNEMGLIRDLDLKYNQVFS